MMKKQLLLVVNLCFAASAIAQQEQMFTQFALNKLVYNPGYAGSFVSPTLTAVYRQQWMGLDGAPNAQVLSYNQPLLDGRVGLGGSIQRQSIGISTSLTVELAYAYRIKMQRGTLCVGLQASMRNLRQNWDDDRLYALDQFDDAIPLESKSKFLPNLGAGIYYAAYKDKWFAGISIPRLLANSIDFAEYGTGLSREVQHINAMGGMTFDVNKELKITPQALFRYALGAPFDAELNVSALLRKKFYGGLTYRVGGDEKHLGESIDAMLGMQVTDNLFFSLSYDIGITRLRKYNNGSLEATARWWFNPPADVENVEPDRPF
jgi:type IX secretion system PorP/SprF family membrane protein